MDVDENEASVAWLKVNQSDLLLLDMIMDPGIDGYETYGAFLSTVRGKKR